MLEDFSVFDDWKKKKKKKPPALLRLGELELKWTTGLRERKDLTFLTIPSPFIIFTT